MRTINLDNYHNSINYYGGVIRNSIVEYFISFLEQGEEITEICEYVFTANNQAFRGHISRIEDEDVIDSFKNVFAINDIHFHCLQSLKAIVFCWKDKYYYISY